MTEQIVAGVISQILNDHGLPVVMVIILLGMIIKLWLHTNKHLKDVRASAIKDRDRCDREMKEIRKEHRKERDQWVITVREIIDEVMGFLKSDKDGHSQD